MFVVRAAIAVTELKVVTELARSGDEDEGTSVSRKHSWVVGDAGVPNVVSTRSAETAEIVGVSRVEDVHRAWSNESFRGMKVRKGAGGVRRRLLLLGGGVGSRGKSSRSRCDESSFCRSKEGTRVVER